MPSMAYKKPKERGPRAVSADPKDPTAQNAELRAEILERFAAASTAAKDWNDVAKEDYDFAMGEQWTPEDLQILKEAGRPALTFNRIRPIINLVSGYQRENSSRLKVNPEGGEDRIFSEVNDRAMKHIDKRAHVPHKMAYWFDDGLYTGKGWLEGIITYDTDPIRGELNFLQRSPYQILVDPDHTEYDLNDGARYAFKIVRLDRATLKELYPKHANLISGFVKDSDDQLENGDALLREGSDDDYANRPNATTTAKKRRGTTSQGLSRDETFTVKEYWRVKRVDRWFVIDKESGEPRKFTSKAEADTFAKAQGSQFKVIERKVGEMWVAAMVGGFVVQDELSPFEPEYTGFPFFRFLADWAPNASSEVLKVQGLTRGLKDPQREKNKAKSQNLHILSTQANSGWVGDEDALSDSGWSALEKMGSKPGITVKKKRGRELREILPKGPNAGQLQREEKADEEFKQISLVNPDLMGFQEGTASGKAISMRIRQAILGLVRIFYNYRYSKEIVGLFILKMIPRLFDAKKLAKVLGPEYMKNAVDQQKYPEGLTEGHLRGFLTMIGDQRYDVAITEADQNQTLRYEIFQDLTELAKSGLPIPVELLIDYMDLPNSQEVKERVAQEQQRQAAMAASAKGAPRA